MVKGIVGSPLFLIGGIIIGAIGAVQFYTSAVVPVFQKHVGSRIGG